MFWVWGVTFLGFFANLTKLKGIGKNENLSFFAIFWLNRGLNGLPLGKYKCITYLSSSFLFQS